jgi:5-methylcytosine-specific restriction endonuclease McrA
MRCLVPTSTFRRVFREANYTCAICGLVGREQRSRGGSWSYPTSEPGISLSLDHTIPKRFGGLSTLANLQCLCTRCNSRKGARQEQAAQL